MELGTKILIFILSLPTIVGIIFSVKKWLHDRKNAKIEEVKPMSPDQFKRRIKSQTSKISKPVLIEEAEVVQPSRFPIDIHKKFNSLKKKGIIKDHVTIFEWYQTQPQYSRLKLELSETNIISN